MSKVEELLLKIDETRKLMTDLMEEKENLLDPDVIEASQKLDKVLNDYHEAVKKSKGNR